MSATITGRGEELLKAKNFCHVATLRADGTIHGVPVWVDIQDGRPVVNSAEGRGWVRNLERDPRVTLTVQNMENPYEYLEVRGRVAEQHARRCGRAHRLARQEVHGRRRVPLPPARRTARDHPRRARARAPFRVIAGLAPIFGVKAAEVCGPRGRGCEPSPGLVGGTARSMGRQSGTAALNVALLLFSARPSPASDNPASHPAARTQTQAPHPVARRPAGQLPWPRRSAS